MLLLVRDTLICVTSYAALYKGIDYVRNKHFDTLSAVLKARLISPQVEDITPLQKHQINHVATTCILGCFCSLLMSRLFLYGIWSRAIYVVDLHRLLLFFYIMKSGYQKSLGGVQHLLKILFIMYHYENPSVAFLSIFELAFTCTQNYGKVLPLIIDWQRLVFRDDIRSIITFQKCEHFIEDHTTEFKFSGLFVMALACLLDIHLRPHLHWPIVMLYYYNLFEFWRLYTTPIYSKKKCF